MDPAFAACRASRAVDHFLRLLGLAFRSTDCSVDLDQLARRPMVYLGWPRFHHLWRDSSRSYCAGGFQILQFLYRLASRLLECAAPRHRIAIGNFVFYVSPRHVPDGPPTET